MKHKIKSLTLSKAIGDFTDSKILMLSFVPFFAPLIIFSILLFFGSQEIVEFLQQSALATPVETTAQSVGFFSKLLQHAVVHWILSVLVYVFAWFLVLYISIFISLVVTGLMAPIFISFVKNKHYKEIETESMKFTNVLWIAIKNCGMFLVLFFAILPLLILPIFNFMIINLPLYFLFHKLILLDVTSELMNENEYKEVFSKFNLHLATRTGSFYLISLVPFIGLFLQPFFVIYLVHYYLENNKYRIGITKK